MRIKEHITHDLKEAMKARDKRTLSVLQSVKSAILYKEVADGKREEGLGEDDVIAVLKKEKKSRQDSLTLYRDANENERADEEAFQIAVIERYLPASLGEDETRTLVEVAIRELDLQSVQMKDMGAIMSFVKQDNPAVEGAVVSRLIKQKMESDS